jgi:hypothetical protein
MIKNKLKKHRLTQVKFPDNSFSVDVPDGMTTDEVGDVLVKVFGVVGWDKVLGEGSLLENIRGNDFIERYNSWTLIIRFIRNEGDLFYYRSGWTKNPVTNDYTPPQKYEWDEFINMKSPYNLGQSR